VSERQVSQVSQVSGRNTELMFLCFALSNLTKIECDADLVNTFKQKLVEEGERTEIGYVGILREVLGELWNEKQGKTEYITEDKLVKISNKEIYDTFNEKLKKEQGQGVSPQTFKAYMLEFGFTDALNRIKLEVPIPTDPKPKSRLCNIFTNRVLRKIGTDESEQKTLQETLEAIKQWIVKNKDSEGLVDLFSLTEYVKTLTQENPTKIVDVLKSDGQLFDVDKPAKLGVK